MRHLPMSSGWCEEQGKTKENLRSAPLPAQQRWLEMRSSACGNRMIARLRMILKKTAAARITGSAKADHARRLCDRWNHRLALGKRSTNSTKPHPYWVRVGVNYTLLGMLGLIHG